MPASLLAVCTLAGLLVAGCTDTPAIASTQCVRNSECAEGLSCIEGACRAECISTRDCAMGEECNPAGQCVPAGSSSDAALVDSGNADTGKQPATDSGINRTSDAGADGQMADATGDPMILTPIDGVPGASRIPAEYVDGTESHRVEFIDFDEDGFEEVAVHTTVPIPGDYYSTQGVWLTGLIARHVGFEPWTSSPPMGAWPQGPDTDIAPFTFVFDDPVASVGFFAYDVPVSLSASVTLRGGMVVGHSFAGASGPEEGTFVGFVANGNHIEQVQFTPTSRSVIDDIRFGWAGP